MAGLCGIASRAPGHPAAGHLDRMIAALHHLSWHRVERFKGPSGQLVLGRVHLGILPAAASSSSWIHGEESDGFVEVTLDPVTGCVIIRNDAFGMMPLFYCQTKGALVFATEVKAVAAHPEVEVRLDERGLADLLAFGFLLGDKTLLRGVRCLPGGSRLTFDPATGELRQEQAWDFRGRLGRSASDRPATLERISTAFRRAVSSRCSGDARIGVSLSGGLDSRSIMAAVDNHRHRVQTLTVDVAGGADRVIAERISRRTNGLSNHHVVENSADFFSRWPAYVREMVWLTDGMYYDEACVMMPTLECYREAGIDVVLRGHGGELARMSEAYELRVDRHVRACRTQSDLKDHLFGRMNFGIREEELRGLLAPPLSASLQGAARASFEEAFAGVDPAWSVVDQTSCLYAQQYLPRQCVPSLAQLRSRVEVRLPFLDRDYVSTVLELPPQDRINSTTHAHLLRRLNPALLRITNGNTGTWAGAPPLLQLVSRKGLQLMKRYLGYERYRHYVDPRGWLRGPLHAAVASVLLDRRTASDGLFAPKAVREALESHRTGGADHSVRLLLLLYVELWRRLFLEGEPWSPQTDPVSCGSSSDAS